MLSPSSIASDEAEKDLGHHTLRLSTFACYLVTVVHCDFWQEDYNMTIGILEYHTLLYKIDYTIGAAKA